MLLYHYRNTTNSGFPCIRNAEMGELIISAGQPPGILKKNRYAATRQNTWLRQYRVPGCKQDLYYPSVPDFVVRLDKMVDLFFKKTGQCLIL
jgi:hypothetical protein